MRLFTARIAALTCLLAVGLRAQAPSSSVSGTVYDAQTGRPIAGTVISVNGQTGDNMKTGSEGRFNIPLSPGTYTLRFEAANYSDVTVNNVIVKAGEVTEASTIMSNKALVTRIDVVEKVSAVGATAEAMLSERKLSASVSDSVSREELLSGTSSDAAGALEKVTGVSVVGEGFVFVRGLGERYSATMLNNAIIPTTEPDKRVVPLDLFPAGLIENIKILKTYTPDLPAEFSAGLVQMSTVEFPTVKTFGVNVKSGFNTRTTFGKFLTYPGGSYDFFGFGGGARAIPPAIPANARVIQGAFTPTQLQDFGRSFSDNWEPVNNDAVRPPLDWSVMGGGTFGRLGIVGALSLSNAPQTVNEMQKYYRQGGNGPILSSDYSDFNDYTERARLGGVLNLAFRLSPNNKLILRNTVTHDGEKSAREFAGYDGDLDSNIASQRLHYVERSLYSGSLEGDHSAPDLHNSVFHWQFTYSRSRRNEPDLREVFRGLLDNGRYIFASLGSSGVRFFSDLNDNIYEPQADYSIPFFKGSISGLFKVGFRATVRERDFAARRFIYSPRQTSTLNLYLPSNQLFAESNIRPTGFQLVEFTRGTDTYTADMNVYAGYAMVDLALGSRWRLVGGVRIEDADIRVTTLDNLVPNSDPQVAQLTNRDPAPAVNLIYALRPKQNLRISYSRTLSRPDFRELSPFDFNDVLGGFVVQGNPNLQRTAINNYDARWEAFLGGNQVIAASVFAKTFASPIEQTVLPSNDLRQTFVNAKGARNIGVELEFRKNLASIATRLHPFSVSSNFTFVDSNIEIRPEDATVVTSQSRPLLGQSRYIYNVIGEWVKPSWRSQARFYANHVSRRISGVGTFGLPDYYQEGNTFLDFIYQVALDEKGRWNFRFEAENLGDTEYRWTQGGLPQRSYQLGRTFQTGVGYTF